MSDVPTFNALYDRTRLEVTDVLAFLAYDAQMVHCSPKTSLYWTGWRNQHLTVAKLVDVTLRVTRLEINVQLLD